ncbi:MAG TPA: GerMN domain-containing protein [Thermoanaerobacterales bacterium]|nr:GerMN domain-containing protein [Thermoanaerobacterales bacterium]
MKGTRLFAIIIIFIAVMILAGCDAQPAASDQAPVSDQKNPAVIYEGQDQSKVLVYYVKDGYLVPITLGIEPTKEPIKAALDLLFSGMTPQGFENKLFGVELKSYSIAGDTVSLDLSEAFLKGDDRDLKRDQLVLTLTEFDGIKKVMVKVGGKAEESLYERPPFINRVFLPEEDVLAVSGGERTQADDTLLTVYFADRDKKYIVPVSFKSSKLQVKTDQKGEIIPPTPEEKAKAAVEQLIEGPVSIKNLNGIFPREVKVKDFYIKDGIAYVDVSKDLILSFSKDDKYEKIAVESVVQTLTSIDEIDKVRFLIDGKEIPFITGHTNISSPIPRLKWYNIIE